MANRLDRQDEERILKALDRDVDRVQDGEHPNDAIVKAASDADLPAGHIRLMVHAFNRGRANTQRKLGDTVFDKAASISLADAETVVDRVFRQPVREKIAAASTPLYDISDEYREPPTWQNDPRLSGQPLLPEPDNTPRRRGAWDKRAAVELGQLDRQVSELRQQAFRAGEKAASAVDELEQFFRRKGQGYFDACQKQAVAGYGRPAEKLFEALSGSLKSLRKFASAETPTVLIDQQQAPWKQIDRFLKEAQLHRQLVQQADNLEKHPDVVQLRARTPAGEARRVIKEAAEASPIGPAQTAARKGMGAIGQAFSSKFQSGLQRLSAPLTQHFDQVMPKWTGNDDTKEELENKAYADLTDPVHELHVQQIQAKAVLHDLLANDPIISGHDPEEVLNHFNDLQRLAPRAAQQPALLRALLRKQLGQGQLDTHDLSQVTEIENRLNQSRRGQGVRNERDLDPQGK